MVEYGKHQDPDVREERRQLAENDVALRYLGYWTDNGMYTFNINCLSQSV